MNNDDYNELDLDALIEQQQAGKEQASEEPSAKPKKLLPWAALHKPEGIAQGGITSPPLWMITFADIMAIMLTFFVLMYSMSVMQEDKWVEVSTSINRGMTNGMSVAKSPKWYSGEQDTISIEKLDYARALNLDYLQSLVQSSVDKNENLQRLVIIRQEGRLILSLPSDMLFSAGDDAVSLDGKKALFALGGILSRIKNRIEVIGHADPRPIRGTGGAFSSNWELSLSRAVNVSVVLAGVGYERPVIVRGLSSARYDELPADMTEERRLDLSRRVDLVIMKDDGRHGVF